MREENDIVPLLLTWYRRSRRDLPWRRTVDPYRIWVSEIILQQTRVAQGTAYYLRFLERFPDVMSLATASPDEVMKVWEGLGYYSRARNMHAAARHIAGERGGRFPTTYEDLLALKGVGPYTAAAVASIAFGEAVPVLDGNVFRVVSRLFALPLPRGGAGDRKVRDLLEQLIPADAAGDFNQALMELGALICTPGEPACDACPLHDHCLARKKNMTTRLPVATPPAEVKKRYFHYLVAECCGEILVAQRSGKDIWQLLWEFPSLETDKGMSPGRVLALFEERLPAITGGERGDISQLIRHQLTHRTILARFYHVTLPRWPVSLNSIFVKTPVDKLREFAFPRLITSYMEAFPERFGR